MYFTQVMFWLVDISWDSQILFIKNDFFSQAGEYCLTIHQVISVQFLYTKETWLEVMEVHGDWDKVDLQVGGGGGMS